MLRTGQAWLLIATLLPSLLLGGAGASYALFRCRTMGTVQLDLCCGQEDHPQHEHGTLAKAACCQREAHEAALAHAEAPRVLPLIVAQATVALAISPPAPRLTQVAAEAPTLPPVQLPRAIGPPILLRTLALRI